MICTPLDANSREEFKFKEIPGTDRAMQAPVEDKQVETFAWGCAKYKASAACQRNVQRRYRVPG